MFQKHLSLCLKLQDKKSEEKYSSIFVDNTYTCLQHMKSPLLFIIGKVFQICSGVVVPSIDVLRNQLNIIK